MSASVDVLVAGAGPAGIAAGLIMAEAGLHVRIVDRARFPRPKPCAEYLSPGTLAELQHLGLLEAADQAGGTALRGTAVFGPRGARLLGCFALAGHHPVRPTGLSLSRWSLDAALVRAARNRGVEIVEGTALEQLLYHGGAVAGAVLRQDGRRISCRARLVIGADGLRSVVARGLGGMVHGGPRRLALVAHMEGISGLGGTAQMHVGHREYVGINPLGEGLANVAMVVPAGTIGPGHATAADRFAQALRRIETAGNLLHEARVAGPVRVTGPFGVRARRLVADGAILAGDAAEFYDPFTGEGIGTALHGGRLAAEAGIEALAGGQAATARRLQPYLAARRRAFRGKWAVERLIGWAVEAPALFDRALQRLERAGHAHTLVGVTGNFVPPRAILNLRVLSALVR